MTVMELMHRLNLKHLLSLSCPGLGLLAHFSSVTVALPRFHGLQRSGSSALSSATTSKKDTERKRREKETAQKREGKERDSFAVFPSKALPHCSRFWLILRSQTIRTPAMTQGRRPERALCVRVLNRVARKCGLQPVADNAARAKVDRLQQMSWPVTFFLPMWRQ